MVPPLRPEDLKIPLGKVSHHREDLRDRSLRHLLPTAAVSYPGKIRTPTAKGDYVPILYMYMYLVIRFSQNPFVAQLK